MSDKMRGDLLPKIGCGVGIVGAAMVTWALFHAGGPPLATPINLKVVNPNVDPCIMDVTPESAPVWKANGKNTHRPKMLTWFADNHHKPPGKPSRLYRYEIEGKAAAETNELKGPYTIECTGGKHRVNSDVVNKDQPGVDLTWKYNVKVWKCASYTPKDPPEPDCTYDPQVDIMD